jgi:hypothetical protein
LTDAELRSLLLDCLTLWAVDGRVAVDDAGVTIATQAGDFVVQRAPAELRPVRWLLQTPERQVASRPPRATPSIVALLSSLRNAVGGEGGRSLRIGGAGQNAAR